MARGPLVMPQPLHDDIWMRRGISVLWDAETLASTRPPAAALLHLGSLGSIRTQTARAFDAAEMQKILGLLPK
jgi:hypothetical protein